MKHSILLLCAVVASFFSFGQQNYQPGYIVVEPNDTIRGFVDYRNWKVNPSHINFKKSLDEVNGTSYDQYQIKSFSVSEEAYESAIVDIEVSSEDVNQMSREPEFKIEKQAALLQLIIKGSKSLYYLKSRVGKDNFYIKNSDNSFQLLLYKKYFKTKNEGESIQENNKYTGQLALYLAECSNIRNKLQFIKYNHKSLEKLFTNYYSCTGQDIQFTKETEGVKLELSIIAGLTSTTGKFTLDGEPYFPLDLDASKNISAGFAFDLSLPRNQRKWVLGNELFYSAYKLEGTSTTYVNDMNYSIKKTSISYSYGKINTIVRFRYPVKKIFIFANLGMSNGFAFSEKSENTIFRKFYSTEETTVSPAFGDTRKYEQGLLFGGGVTYKKFSIEYRQERGNGMVTGSRLGSSIIRNHFLVSYRINK